MKNNIAKTGIAAAILALAVQGLAACQSGQQEAGTSTETDISKQIAVYVSNRSVWIQDDEFETYYYALHDLDRDGSMELLVTTCQGSGWYTYSDFYRLEDGMTSVAKIPQEDWLELDIGTSQPDIYRDYGSGEIYFYGTDWIRYGITGEVDRNGYFRYDGGRITDITIIGGCECLNEVADGVTETTETYFDGDGSAISLEAWRAKMEEFKEDKLLTGDVFFWDRRYMEDYEPYMSTLSDEEMQEYLEKLYMQYQQYIANRDYDTVMERLSAYPADYDAPSEEAQSEAWQQFADAVEQGTPAQIVVAATTTEGDAILTYLDYNGHNIYGITDYSRDGFAGSGCPYSGFCYTYLKAFEETDEAGGVRRIWALVNRKAETIGELQEAGDDYREVFFQ